MLVGAERCLALLAALIYLCRSITPISCGLSGTYQSRRSSLKTLGKLVDNDNNDELRSETKNSVGRMYPAIPTYDLLNLPSGLEVPHESLIDLLTKRQEYNNTNDSSTNEFLKNLKLLRKSVDKDELKQMSTHQQAITLANTGKRHNVSTDEDINTINLLIGMLMLAERRLIEQRDRLVVGKMRQGNRRQQDFSTDDRKSQQLATNQWPVTDFGTKLAPMNKSLDLFNGSSFWSLASAHSPAKRLSGSKLDHVLVRPGFSLAHARISNGMNRNGGEQKSASRLSATGVLPNRNSEYPIMFPHKPVVAQDLLHVNRGTYSDEVPGGADFPNSHRARHLFYEQLDRRLMNPNLHHLGGHQLQSSTMVPPYNGYPLVHPLFGSHNTPVVGNQGFSGLETPPYGIQQYRVRSPVSLHLKDLGESHSKAAEEHGRRQNEHALEIERRQASLRREHERLRQLTASMTTTERPNQVTTESNLNEQPVSQSPDTGNQSDGNNGMDEESMNELKQSFPGGFVSDDFTDLFPPGILSDAEIKEMRRHQQQQQEQNQENDQEEPRDEQGDQEEEQPEVGGANSLNQLDEPKEPLGEQQDLSNQSAHQNNSSTSSVETPVANTSNNFTLPISLPARVLDTSNTTVNRGITRFMPNLVAGHAQQPSRSNKTRRSQDLRLSDREQVGAVAQLAVRHLPGPIYQTDALRLADNQMVARGRESGSPLWASTDATTQPPAVTVDQNFDDELM